MDSVGFLLLLRNFTNLTREESDTIQELARQYPYSQLLHYLRSRAAQERNEQGKAELLHRSAVYATDRAFLKWVMTTPRVERIQEPEIVLPAAAPRQESPPEIPVYVPATIRQEESLSGDALRKDILAELEKLQKNKHEFEASVAEFEKLSHGSPPAASDTEPLIAEIKSGKRKHKIENPRQKEQNEIIDQFIKTQPIIPKPSSTVPDADLSEDSSMFSDNIVSETLVEILLKQGKREKAIEVLKKLIWKFPQKKAYFAAQIEDLKN